MEMPYGKSLKKFVREEREQHNIYPPAKATFAAFDLTEFESVKCVIIGQDPYHGFNQAMGLAFSVPIGEKIPPSLDNIFKEYSSDLGVPAPVRGNLEKWAKQGVLLLNTTLTVRAASPMSHAHRGWETLTSKVIKTLSDETSGIVFILWGKHAQSEMTSLIDESKHAIIAAPHPSPLSAYKGFFGSKPFSKTNELLVKYGKEPIDWVLN